MAIDLFQYDILSSELLKALSVKENISLQVRNGENERYVDEDTSVLSKRSILLGKVEDWDPKRSIITINRSIEIENPLFLFSEDQLGIIPPDAVAGVAAEFRSASSKQRKIVHTSYIFPDTIKRGSTFKINYKVTFPKDTCRGLGKLVEFLYIAAPQSSYYGFRANSAGLVLGDLLKPIEIVFDGHGSMFPIIEINKLPTDELWNLRANWEDPEEDAFSEDNIALIINKNHPKYLDFDFSEIDKPNALRNEVVAGWVNLLFIVMADRHPNLFEELLSGDRSNCHEGSIAHWLWYFITAFEIQGSNLENWQVEINRAIHGLLG